MRLRQRGSCMDTTRERERTSTAAGGSSQDFAQTAGDVAAAAGEAAGQAVEETRDFAEQKKDAGADNMARLGQAVHGAADQLGKELPQAAGLIHSAADTLQGAASSMRERSIEDMV